MDIKCLNNKGLSLVEVILAALMLTVVLAALFATYRNASNLMASGRNKILALVWAQSVIEDQKDGVTTDDPTVRNMLFEEKTFQGNPIAPVLAEVDEGGVMRRLKVTIQWTE